MGDQSHIVRMMVPLHLLLGLVTLSQARSISPPTAGPNQVPVSDTRFDDGAVNFGSGMPLPGFTPGVGPQYGSLGGPIAYGGQSAYGDQPAHGGQPGYGHEFMNTPVFGGPHAGFDRYFGGPYGGFG